MSKKVTQLQQQMLDRLNSGEKITDVNLGGMSSRYEWPNGELCRYKVFWNLMYNTGLTGQNYFNDGNK